MPGKGRTQDQAKRRKLRRRLEALGYRPAQIEKRVAELDGKRARMHEARERSARAAQQQAELEDATRKASAAAQERAEAETYARLCPDDTGFRPSTPDSLRTGAARATGVTAKVAGRRNTITKWQYDEMEGTR
jgi:hypothetical protein